MNINIEAQRLSQVWEVLATDTQLSLYVTELDRSYFESRVKAEGMSFLTVTLPALGKSLDRSFETGYLAPVQGFVRVRDTPYPCFLRKAWETLFDKEGILRWNETSPNGVISYSNEEDDMDYANAAYCLRQLTLLFYKMKLPFEESKVRQVYARFGENESFLRSFDWGGTDRTLLTRARHIVCRLLCGSNPLDVEPRHGSGSSACGVRPYLRYGNPRYIAKLDRLFPYSDYFYSGKHALSDKLAELQASEEYDPVAKVVLVPKDSRGPRLISMEPRETMFIQQGLMAKLYKYICKYKHVQSQLSCIDQTRNQRLTALASCNRLHATIDMKDASDLVSCQLVRELFPPDWVEALFASRSEATLVEGVRTPLEKFAPMGSAVCFPVEAIVFWAVCLAAQGVTDDYVNRLFSGSLTESEVHRLSVFGDDIVCDSRSVHRVIDALESVGLKVNRDKCYTTGPFRESCGCDMFLGRNITPIRISHLPVAKGSKTQVNYAKFRAIDWMNNLIDCFGWHIICDKLSALFQEWYGDHMILPSKGDSMVSSSTNTLALRGGHRKIPAKWRVKSEPSKDPSKPYFCRSMVFAPIERAKTVRISNDDWSHVLRSLLNQGGREGTSVVSLTRRHVYRNGWTLI